MSFDWQKDVEDFQKKFGKPHRSIPQLPSRKEMDFRMDLIDEEYDELKEAVENNNLEKIVDGLGDLIYVILGFAIYCGVDMSPIWDEIHESNMRKEGGHNSPHGKVLKPEGWVGPRIIELLIEQGWEIQKVEKDKHAPRAQEKL